MRTLQVIWPRRTPSRKAFVNIIAHLSCSHGLPDAGSSGETHAKPRLGRFDTFGQ